MIMEFNGPVMWSPGMSLDELERQVILKAYRFFQFNKTATSNSLGINRSTLDARLERYEQEDKDRERREDERRKSDEEFSRRERGYPAAAAPDPAGRSEPPREPSPSPSTHSGVRMESASQSSTQPAVSMSERSKVQEMLPKQTRRGRHRRSGEDYQGPDGAA